MKAVIDTNVVISGLFWKGPPAEVLAMWFRKRFEWIVSADILEEYHLTLQALETKYGPSPSAKQVLREISLSATLLVPAKLREQVCTDPDDDKFIAAAVATGTSTIVTGDKALLHTDGYGGIRVIKPVSFLKLL